MGLNNRDSFTSKFGVIAAAAGSAIGLGNIWKFPYEVGVNGGGAFLLLYLFFILAFGVPVMLSELLIGRTTQKNVFGAFKELAPKSPWFLVGIIPSPCPFCGPSQSGTDLWRSSTSMPMQM